MSVPTDVGVRADSELVISSCEFDEDGSVLVVYMRLPDDVRNGGLLISSHRLRIAPGGPKDYADLIDDLRGSLLLLLVDALEDVASTPAVEPVSDQDEGDDDDDDG